jgi:hypothetical protein
MLSMETDVIGEREREREEKGAAGGLVHGARHGNTTRTKLRTASRLQMTSAFSAPLPMLAVEAELDERMADASIPITTIVPYTFDSSAHLTLEQYRGLLVKTPLSEQVLEDVRGAADWAARRVPKRGREE